MKKVKVIKYGKKELVKWLREHRYYKEGNWLENYETGLLKTKMVFLSSFLQNYFMWDTSPQGDKVWYDIYKEIMKDER